MATNGGNRRRKKKRGAAEHSLWGYLFREQTDSEHRIRRSFFSHGEEADEEEEEEEENRPFWLRLWRFFNFWSTAAVLIFLAFTAGLTLLLVRMWIPQDMNDIAGYKDTGRARDLESLIADAEGAPITITEAELNRYLRDTCRMRQTGIFSIIASGQGVAARVHDGYLELVLDRLLGSNLHQTTSVNLSFRQESNLGRPELKVDFHGGDAIAGSMPRGGSIGAIGVPQRHIRMLTPALESLLACYPRITEAFEKYHYCPIFTKGKNGEDSRIHLVPYSPY